MLRNKPLQYLIYCVIALVMVSFIVGMDGWMDGPELESNIVITSRESSKSAEIFSTVHISHQVKQLRTKLLLKQRKTFAFTPYRQ
jgi:hypothetical protein